MKPKEHYAHLLEGGDWASDKELHRDAKRAVRQRALEKAYVEDLKRRENVAFWKRNWLKAVTGCVILPVACVAAVAIGSTGAAEERAAAAALSEIMRETEFGTLTEHRAAQIIGSESSREFFFTETQQIEQFGKVYAPYVVTRYWDRDDGSTVAVRFIDGGEAIRAWVIPGR
jgi:hypothetical protein